MRRRFIGLAASALMSTVIFSASTQESQAFFWPFCWGGGYGYGGGVPVSTYYGPSYGYGYASYGYGGYDSCCSTCGMSNCCCPSPCGCGVSGCSTGSCGIGGCATGNCGPGGCGVDLSPSNVPEDNGELNYQRRDPADGPNYRPDSRKSTYDPADESKWKRSNEGRAPSSDPRTNERNSGNNFGSEATPPVGSAPGSGVGDTTNGDDLWPGDDDMGNGEDGLFPEERGANKPTSELTPVKPRGKEAPMTKQPTEKEAVKAAKPAEEKKNAGLPAPKAADGPTKKEDENKESEAKEKAEEEAAGLQVPLLNLDGKLSHYSQPQRKRISIRSRLGQIRIARKTVDPNSKWTPVVTGTQIVKK